MGPTTWLLRLRAVKLVAVDRFTVLVLCGGYLDPQSMAGKGKGVASNSIAVPSRAVRNRCEVLDRAVD